MSTLLKNSFPHIIAVLSFVILTIAYFAPQMQGLVVQQSDILHYQGMAQEAKEFEEETGEKTLWTNSMFGGMPTYQIRTVVNGNQLHLVDKLARLNIANPIGRFLAAMVGFYVLMILFGVNPWLSMIGAVAFSFTTNNFQLFEAGHNTKLAAISYFPILISGLLLIFRKNYLLGGIIFALGLGLDLFANHVQMTYYLFMTLIIYGVAQLVYCIREKEMAHFWKATGVVALGLVLGIGSTASNLYVTYDYSRDTMRGEAILKSENPGEVKSSSETDGLDWDYAMQWSNGTIDLFSSFIPGVAGGGGNEKLSDSSPLLDDPNWNRLVRSNGSYGPLYWGELPFTSAPIYYGAGIFLFFLMGLFLVDGPVKWWLGLGTLLTLMLSMGKNLEAFNEFFFYNFPLYNKFRTPNSVLSVASFLIPLLAILGLHELFSGKKSKEKILQALYVSTGIVAVICLFFALVGPGMYDFSSPADQRYISAGYSGDALLDARAHLMRSDSFRSLLIVLLSAGLIWAYVQNRLKQSTIVIAALGLITLFDLWSVGKRYLNADSFVSPRNNQARFTPNAADQEILKDQDPNFRVMDLAESTFQSSRASYLHKSLGGYHAAKLQRYNDIIERHLSQGNQAVVDMLNTKYFIIGDQRGQAPPQARPNPGALGNAWFVNEVKVVNSPNEEIDGLNGFNPRQTAIVLNEFQDYVTGLNLSPSGTIQLTDYKPNHLTYQSNTDSEQLAVFSEIWYNKGWHAYIDGEKVDHIRANYVLRAMKVPAGSHKIEFKFDPQSYKLGVMASAVCSSLILLALVGYIGYNGYQSYQNMPAPNPTPTPKPKREAPKTKARRTESKNSKRKNRK